MKNLHLLILACIFVFTSCDSNDNYEPLPSDIIDAENWMNNLLIENPLADAITFKKIVMPRSHDAAMYNLSTCTIGANKCNTQNQNTTITDQLFNGIRMFDIRPYKYQNKYWSHHAPACNGLGCLGDNMETILTMVNDFLENHNELVILEMGTWCYTSEMDANFMALLNNILGDKIYKDDGTNPTMFINRPLQTIIPPNENSGKVLLLFEDAAISSANYTQGIFDYSYYEWEGSTSGGQSVSFLAENQASRFLDFDESQDRLFRLTWQLGLGAELSIKCFLTDDGTSIQDLAFEANPELATYIDAWIADGTITRGNIPNIISTDFVGKFLTEECVKLTHFNLDI